MPTTKTIIFDLDGTLIDSSALICKAFNHALSPFNITLTLEEIDEMRALTSNKLFIDRLSPEDARQAVARLWDFSSKAASETILIPGIKPLLENISAKGWTIGLWTGRDRLSAGSILQYHQIKSYFKGMVGGCEVQNNKPHPEGLHLLASRLKTDLSTMIHVGDHDHDLLGANAAGVVSILAKWRHTNQKQEQLATHAFNEIIEFQNWLNL